MPPPLDSLKLYDIKKAFEYYKYEVEFKDLEANDVKWLIEFVGDLLRHVEHQKGIIYEQTKGLRDLGVSMDTLKKEVGTFMRKRKASSEAEGGELRSKRVQSEFNNDSGSEDGGDGTDGGLQKRPRIDDSEDETGNSKRMRRSRSKSDTVRPKRSRAEETEEGGKSKRRRRS